MHNKSTFLWPVWILGHTVLMTGHCFAQFQYTFQATTATYTEISPGSPVTTGGNPNAFLNNDVTSDPINIGFSFAYSGVIVQQVKANSNGFVMMELADAPTQPEMSDNSVFATAVASMRPIVAPLWDNLAGATGGTASIARYATGGIAPNRVFTIEWRNWRWNANAGGPVISFQCKLFESSNIIEFNYRQEGTGVNNGSASIGLISSSGPYYSLDNVGINPTPSTSIATINLNMRPQSNQLYRFTPTGCTGPVVTSVSSNAPICVNTPLNLSVTATGTAPITYNWSGGGSFNDATIASPVVTGAVNGPYSVTVQNWCGTSVDTTVSVQVTQQVASANAGQSEVICLTPNVTTQLNANDPIPGNGSWSILAGSPDNSPSQFNDVNDDDAAFSPNFAGTYTLAWTVINPPCNPTTDTLTITVNEVIPADAGDSLSICSSVGTAQMNAADPFPGTGLWDQISGPSTAIIANSTSNSTGVSGMTTVGVYEFTWITSIAPCPPDTDTVAITVVEQPVVDSIYYSATSYCTTGGSITPVVLASQSGTFSADSNGLSINPATGVITLGTSQGDTYEVLFEIAVPGCSVVSDNFDITIVEAPNAGSPIDTTFLCTTDPAFNLFLAVQDEDPDGDWYDPNGSPHSSSYVPSIDDPGTYAYVVSEGPTCPNDSAFVEIQELSTPSQLEVLSLDSGTVCQGQYLELTASSIPANAEYHWSCSGCSPTPGLLETDPNLIVHWVDIGGGTGQYSVYASIGGCNSGIVNQTVTILPDTASCPKGIVFFEPHGLAILDPAAKFFEWRDANGNALSTPQTAQTIFNEAILPPGASNLPYYMVRTSIDGQNCWSTTTIWADQGSIERECFAPIVRVGGGLQRLSVYPNPASSSQLTLESLGLWSDLPFLVELTDMGGRRIAEEQVVLNPIGRLSVDISTLDRGVYVLRARNTQLDQTFKLVLN